MERGGGVEVERDGTSTAGEIPAAAALKHKQHLKHLTPAVATPNYLKIPRKLTNTHSRIRFTEYFEYVRGFKDRVKKNGYSSKFMHIAVLNM